LFRKTGSYVPIAYTGRPSVIKESKIEEVHSAIKNEPDITLSELIEKLSLPIQKSQLSRLLISLGYSYKKKRLIPQNKTALMSKKRE
jgi:transposase